MSKTCQVKVTILTWSLSLVVIRPTFDIPNDSVVWPNVSCARYQIVCAYSVKLSFLFKWIGLIVVKISSRGEYMVFSCNNNNNMVHVIVDAEGMYEYSYRKFNL